MFEQVLAQPAQSLLERLGETPALKPFYLAGGTGLALQLGHRLSVDLDWFAREEFDGVSLAKELEPTGKIQVIDQKPGTLVAEIDRIEIGFYRYDFPLLDPVLEFRGAALASWRDILCMKMTAVGQRSAKRDFVDIYFGLQKGMTLRTLFDLMKKKYEAVEYSEYHLLRSLTYFDEIDDEPMPQMLTEVSWAEIQEFVEDQVRSFDE